LKLVDPASVSSNAPCDQLRVTRRDNPPNRANPLGVGAASTQVAFSVHSLSEAARMIRIGIAAMACAMLATGPALAETAVGDWNGVVASAGGDVRIAFHVQPGAEGELIGTADTPDQGAFHVVLAHVATSGDDLSFDLPLAAGHFAGRWNPRTQEWVGLWSQGGSALPLSLHRGRVSRPSQPTIAGLDGDWTGIVGVEAQMRLRLTYHIRTDQRGTTVVSENPDHLANGATPETIGRIGDHVILSLNVVDGEVQANLSDNGQVMVGALTQAGRQYPLMLTRTR